jgi:hypothetical protein
MSSFGVGCGLSRSDLDQSDARHLVQQIIESFRRVLA